MENRIRTLAVDDEPLALKQLATYIKKISFLELVGECQNAIEAKKRWKGNPLTPSSLI